MISSRNLSALPDPIAFRRLTIALAALDAVMSEEWEMRYYSFDPCWGPDEAMASMRNGSGDGWFAVMCPAGIAIVGLSHEAPSFEPGKPKPWVYAQLPEAFHANVRDEAAFDGTNATFCVWRLATDEVWRSGTPDGIDDGSAALLDILDGNPQRYVDFASDYYEIQVALDDVAAVYRHEALSAELARRLNPEVDYDATRDDLLQLEYPLD